MLNKQDKMRADELKRADELALAVAIQRLGEFTAAVARGEYDLSRAEVKAAIISLSEKIRALDESLEMRARYEARRERAE